MRFLGESEEETSLAETGLASVSSEVREEGNGGASLQAEEEAGSKVSSRWKLPDPSSRKGGGDGAHQKDCSFVLGNQGCNLDTKGRGRQLSLPPLQPEQD